MTKSAQLKKTNNEMILADGGLSEANINIELDLSFGQAFFDNVKIT